MNTVVFSKTIIISILGVVLIGGGIGYWYYTNQLSDIPQAISEVKTVEQVSTSTEAEIPTEVSVPEKTTLNFSSTTVPEGWKTYVDEEWRFMFAYPSHWSFKVNTILNGIRVLNLEGDGFYVQIDKIGRDANSPYSYITKIDGLDAWTWQTEQNDGYHLKIFNRRPQLTISIKTPTKNKELVNEFLSTVRFEKSQ